MRRKGKQRGWQSTLFSLARNQSPSAYLFTQLFVYWRRRDSFLHLLKGNKKASKRWQEQSQVCRKMEALKIEGDKHNVVYIWGASLWGRAQSPPVHKAHHTRLEMEQVLRGSGFRWRDWEMWGRVQHWLWREVGGLCHRSRQCEVTYLSNRKRNFFSATFRHAAHRQGLWTLK